MFYALFISSIPIWVVAKRRWHLAIGVRMAALCFKCELCESKSKKIPNPRTFKAHHMQRKKAIERNGQRRYVQDDTWSNCQIRHPRCDSKLHFEDKRGNGGRALEVQEEHNRLIREAILASEEEFLNRRKCLRILFIRPPGGRIEEISGKSCYRFFGRIIETPALYSMEDKRSLPFQKVK